MIQPIRGAQPQQYSKEDAKKIVRDVQEENRRVAPVSVTKGSDNQGYKKVDIYA